jgi:tetratricopeptide (TPR) repeat protein
MRNDDFDTKNEAPAEYLEPILGLMEANQEEALPRLNTLADQYPDDPRLPFMAGSVLAGLERFTEARAAMQKAVDMAPGYALARFQLGFLALTSGDRAGAWSVWQPLLALPSDNPLNLFVHGLEAMSQDKFAEAIELLEAGIERNRSLAPLNQNMALLVREMQNRLTQDDTATTVGSDAHFLLKQYSFKNTRH